MNVVVKHDVAIRTWWMAALIAAITVAIYWPALGSGFVGDDFMILHRLRALAAPADVARFFRGEFFEYYRPLGFVSHAIDWSIAGQNARQFHLTNILIHTVSSVLILFIGHALSPRSLAGPVAALLFALHASNNEAVVWMSARFDLLATCFGLAAVCWMVRGWTGATAIAPLLFLLGLLSKEAVVALPLAAAGWIVFRGRQSTAGVAARLLPWLLMLVSYSALRHVFGGVSAVGGASRLPKAVAFGLCLAAVIALANGRWQKLRDWLEARRVHCAVVCAAVLAVAILIAATSNGRIASLAREKLTVAGFGIFYLTSPVLGPGEAIFSDPGRTAWMTGAAALLVAGAIVFGLWRRLLSDDRMWFLAAFLVAALLPVSALTEGKRYLYLPSAVASLIAGTLVAESRVRVRRHALIITAAVVIASAVQIAFKIADWRWAGTMTAEGARLVDSSLAPSCGSGHVVFLTSPVGTRGVYSHFYYETFEVPRGCMPETFQVVARVLRLDTHVTARWDGDSRIVVTASAYRGNLLLSHDLRSFDVRLRAGDAYTIATPLGDLSAGAPDSMAELTLTLRPDVRREQVHFFYYSDGRIESLAAHK